MFVRTITILVVLTWGASRVLSEPAPSPTTPPETTLQDNDRVFQETLQGAVLQGLFSVRGKELPVQKERYEIRQVTKQPEDDYWVLMTRVQYGDHDVTVPIPVAVHWAGKTPVITVDNLTIPGLGTFDARVLLHDGLYAGTWRHGDVTGNLWGEIRPAK
ncbi:MAG: hypothetical protein O2931_00335 [Planctomycetota bacterium]|nr:hypothetical protein [Planctomycetota bacterium]MDA1177221.1 hypothetical protein [Planctomycetota bacterium]